jgi:uncharacterized protein (DUF1778 family)
MGRPPLAKKERKTMHLSVRLTTDEHRGLDRAAQAVGLALSDWARSVVLAAAGISAEQKT